jgi:hypothetical protein
MGVSHCGLAIYIKKYRKAKEELWKLKYFTMQKYNLQKYTLLALPWYPCLGGKISLVVQSSMKPKLSNKQNYTLKISSYTIRTSNVYHIPTLVDAT